MNEKHIIFAKKDDKFFYIANTEPFIWTPNVEEAKNYSSRFSAEYEVLKNNQNYMSLCSQISSHVIDALYIARISNNIETERFKIL